jgi:hypothetical protein
MTMARLRAQNWTHGNGGAFIDLIVAAQGKGLNERPAIGSLSSHRTVRNAAEQLGTICGRFRDATTGYVRIGDGCRVWLWRRRG